MRAAQARDEFEKTKTAALRLLKFRERSEKEIIERLSQKNFSKDVIHQTVMHLKELQLLDDRRFVKNWIQSRLTKSVGVRKIYSELIGKGINQKLLEQEFANLEADYPEEETALSLAKKRMEKYKGIDPTKAKQRAYAYLIYRGYEPSVVQDIIEKL